MLGAEDMKKGIYGHSKSQAKDCKIFFHLHKGILLSQQLKRFFSLVHIFPFTFQRIFEASITYSQVLAHKKGGRHIR